jgi:hypothetical protein
VHEVGLLAELEAFAETLRERSLFERGTTVVITRAPGRLDVMVASPTIPARSSCSARSRKERSQRFKLYRSPCARDRQYSKSGGQDGRTRREKPRARFPLDILAPWRHAGQL